MHAMADWRLGAQSLIKKASVRDRGSHLSVEGVALARLVGESLGPFARVATNSAPPHVIWTVVAMAAGPLDRRGPRGTLACPGSDYASVVASFQLLS
jgi:hypothetical protein